MLKPKMFDFQKAAVTQEDLKREAIRESTSIIMAELNRLAEENGEDWLKEQLKVLGIDR